jgi:hypothetical protein
LLLRRVSLVILLAGALALSFASAHADLLSGDTAVSLSSSSAVAASVTTMKLPGCPLSLTAGGGSAYVGLGCIRHNGRLTSGETLAIPSSGGPGVRILSNAPELAYIDGHLWAAGSGRLAKFDPGTGDRIASIRFPGNHLIETLAGNSRGVWVLNVVNRIDGRTKLEDVTPNGRRVIRNVPLRGLEPPRATSDRLFLGLATSHSPVWVLDLGISPHSGEIVDGYILRISARSGRLTGRVSVGHTNTLVVGDGEVWTTREGTGAIAIDTRTLAITRAHVQAFEPFGVGDGGVWFLHRAPHHVAIRRLDPTTLRVDASIPEPSFPSTVGLDPALDTTSGTIWVPSDDRDKLTRIGLELHASP